jgi:hypothetical protein
MATIESMHRRPRRGGIEIDALTTSGQRALIWRAGERAAVKARHSRRVRRATRQALREERQS